MTRTYSGINIQYPISRLIYSGQKTVETRTYPLPSKYIGQEILLIETPGKSREFSARIVAIIKFHQSFPYASESAFYRDIKKHKVDKQSPWAWSSNKPKWGWPVTLIKTFKTPIPLRKKKGIVFTIGIEI